MEIPAKYRRIEGSERHISLGAHRIGPADPKEMLSVSIYVRPRPSSTSLQDDDYWIKTPPGQRKFLTHEEFAEKFGAEQADLDKVINFAHEHGLKVVETSKAQRKVVLSGTVKQINKAFAVELGYYESPREKYRGREGYIHLPADIANIVQGVFGLDNRRMAHPRMKLCEDVRLPLGPTLLEVKKCYNFPSGNANGKTIGIFAFDCGYAFSDIQIFCKDYGIQEPKNIIDVSADKKTINNPTSNNDDDAEVTGDIEIIASIAEGVNIVVYFSHWDQKGWVDAIEAAIFDEINNPSVLCITWGCPELQESGLLDWSYDAIKTIDGYLKAANLQGITIFAASGDTGSNDYINDGLAHVDFPASDPWVAACGGTLISNINTSPPQEGACRCSGGGISDIFEVPSWQIEANITKSVNDGHYGRGVPDVAGHVGSYKIWLRGAPQAYWGTSAVAPLYAGLMALIGGGCGIINQILYFYAKKGVCRDVNDGISNANGTSQGYTAGPGWDACTGLGSINGNVLMVAIRIGGVNGAILGMVTDSNGKPLSDVNISLLGYKNTTTDSSGFYFIRLGDDLYQFTPGIYDLSAGRPDLVQDEVSITISTPYDFMVHDFSLKKKGILKGTVFKADENPLPDATVPNVSVSAVGYADTATDQLGGYVLQLDPGTYKIYVRGQYFEPQEAEVTISSGQTETTQNFTLVKIKPITITGKITDKKGNPIAGLMVICDNYGAGFDSTIKTDSNGAYSFTSDAGGTQWTAEEYHIHTVGAAQFGCYDYDNYLAVADGETKIFDICLESRPTITGRVWKKTVSPILKPIKEAYVYANGSDFSKYFARTDSEGYYNMIVMNPLKYDVWAEAEGCKGSEKITVNAFSVNNDPVTQNFVLEKDVPGTISGMVTGPGEGPIEAATVRCVTAYSNDIKTTTDSSGEYELVGVPSGQRRINITADGFVSISTTVEVICGQTITVDFVLRLRPIQPKLCQGALPRPDESCTGSQPY